jgi:endonuclease G
MKMSRWFVPILCLVIVGCKKPPDNHGNQYTYAGEPMVTVYPNPLQVLTNIGYVVAYDNIREDPVWTCYRVINTTNREPPRPKQFVVDERTTAKVKSADYNGSGYDRGHNAPNRAIGRCYGAQAQLETFLMSNIGPQKPLLNREVWEHLETDELTNYAARFGEAWIITGPVFGAGTNMLKSGVVIPDACYKIIIWEETGTVNAVGYEIPQTVKGTEDFNEFRKDIHDIEKDTGLTFTGGMRRMVLKNDHKWYWRKAE